MSIRWHPKWCARRFCTAYKPEETDRNWHRSNPIIIPDEDDPTRKATYVFLTCFPGGTDPGIESVTLTVPFSGPWWYADLEADVQWWASIADAEEMHKALAFLVAAARDPESAPPAHRSPSVATTALY